MSTSQKDIRAFLDRKVDEYNRPSFIISDPVSIPHLFSHKQDIEIAGFFAAIFSWGNRTTIIRKSRELMQLMDDAPYQFILQHEEEDLKKLLHFKHRTFNATDLLYFISFFRHHYARYDSLEDAFLQCRTLDREARQVSGETRHPGETPAFPQDRPAIGPALSAFYHYFFSVKDETDLAAAKAPGKGPALLAPPRTYKHIASPEKNSSCKRLNMFLRWMVRNDDRGVDFSLWKRLSPAGLICPLDVHVARVARRLGLMTRTTTDWQAALELTDYLITLDAQDPVKYDFALFGLGVMEKF